MSIVTQYGERITDRVVITEHPGDRWVATKFTAAFDSEPIPGVAYSGRGAVNLAKAWLKQRDERRAADAEVARQRALDEQARNDDAFVEQMADRLGLDCTDLARLLDIAGRRAQT